MATESKLLTLQQHNEALAAREQSLITNMAEISKEKRKIEKSLGNREEDISLLLFLELVYVL
ncbi:MAG: hypothetical protein AAF704_13270, partial [Cyanobacteria bacterium P01_D01_bin.123]